MLYCVVWANICSGPGLDPKGRAFHRSRRVLNCLGLKHTVLCFALCAVQYILKNIMSTAWDSNTQYCVSLLCSTLRHTSFSIVKLSVLSNLALVQC